MKLDQSPRWTVDFYCMFGKPVHIPDDFTWFTDGDLHQKYFLGRWFLNHCLRRLNNNYILEFEVDDLRY